MEPKYPVKATRHSVEILEAVRYHGETTLSELSAELDLSQSVIHNHLSTLLSLGLLEREEYSYRIGVGMFAFGAAGRDAQRGFAQARIRVDALARDLGEQVNLMYRDRHRVVVAYQQEGDRAINTGIEMGDRLDSHCTAAGKAILAFSPEEVLESVVEDRGLPDHTPFTITDEDALREELSSIPGDLPWAAYDRSERARGVKAIANPITDESETAIGAFSVCLPNHRFEDTEYRDRVLNRLREAGSTISPNVLHS
jgi:DNA-binding IclR family transcriptional regulator